MRLCAKCGNQFPDDANFCPMDASRLPPPGTSAPDAATVLDGEARLLGGRFLAMASGGAETPTGALREGSDTQNNGQPVSIKFVSLSVLPSTAMADRALRLGHDRIADPGLLLRVGSDVVAPECHGRRRPGQ